MDDDDSNPDTPAEDPDITLVYIQYMKFVRRAKGMKAMRDVYIYIYYCVFMFIYIYYIYPYKYIFIYCVFLYYIYIYIYIYIILVKYYYYYRYHGVNSINSINNNSI